MRQQLLSFRPVVHIFVTVVTLRNSDGTKVDVVVGPAIRIADDVQAQ